MERESVRVRSTESGGSVAGRGGVDVSSETFIVIRSLSMGDNSDRCSSCGGDWPSDVAGSVCGGWGNGLRRLPPVSVADGSATPEDAMLALGSRASRKPSPPDLRVGIVAGTSGQDISLSKRFVLSVTAELAEDKELSE